jgi:hypothetical protein
MESSPRKSGDETTLLQLPAAGSFEVRWQTKGMWHYLTEFMDSSLVGITYVDDKTYDFWSQVGLKYNLSGAKAEKHAKAKA